MKKNLYQYSKKPYISCFKNNFYPNFGVSIFRGFFEKATSDSGLWIMLIMVAVWRLMTIITSRPTDRCNRHVGSKKICNLLVTGKTVLLFTLWLLNEYRCTFGRSTCVSLEICVQNCFLKSAVQRSFLNWSVKSTNTSCVQNCFLKGHWHEIFDLDFFRSLFYFWDPD